jgi:membrane protein
MNKKELSDKTAFLWTLLGIMMLLFVFQQLGNQVQWYLNMAGLLLANEIFGFLVSDKDTVKVLSISKQMYWWVCLLIVCFVVSLMMLSNRLASLVFENATELDLYHLLSLLLIILSSSQLYYGLIYPKIIDSYTNEWIRKDIKRDIRIGVSSFLHSLPMVIFIIGLCMLFHFSGFYPTLWQSTLCYICISSAVFIMKIS